LFLLLYGVGLHFAHESLVAAEQHMRESSTADPMQAMQQQAVRKMFLVLGIYFSSSIVSLLAIFSAVGAVAAEVENGMLHAILAKPIRRRNIILGKFAGYALMLSCYACLLYAAILAINVFIMGSEIKSALPAVGLIVLQPLILLAVTLAGSTKLSTLANGITAFMLYTIGVVGGMVEQVGVMGKIEAMREIGIVTSLVIPIDSIYRMIVNVISKSSGNQFSEMMLGPFGTISEPSSAMAIYAALYLIVFLMLAVRWFTKRDLG
jgi:ABC-type transport system involved in multi-copper enzyme maturation permease subunit